MTSRWFASIGNFSVRFRWPIVIGWVLITIVSVKAFPGLSDVAKDFAEQLSPRQLTIGAGGEPRATVPELEARHRDPGRGARERCAHRVRPAGDQHTRRADPRPLRGDARAGLRAFPRQACGAGSGGHRPAAVQRGNRCHHPGQSHPSDVSQRRIGASGAPHGNDPRFRRSAESVEELAGLGAGIFAALHHRPAADRVSSVARAADHAVARRPGACPGQPGHRRRNPPRGAGVGDHAVHPHRARARRRDGLRPVPRLPNARGASPRPGAQGCRSPCGGDSR